MPSCAPDYEAARDYALYRLERHLPRELIYHSRAHTCEDVLPAAERLAALENVTGHDLLLLRTAAMYHDLGFTVRLMRHEEHSAELADIALPMFGYEDDDVRIICAMILVTRVFTRPSTLLEAILVDADLDVLGRGDFWDRNAELRRETEALNQPISDAAWYGHQVKFMETHVYRTRAAQITRDPKKQENLQAVRKLLVQCV